MSLRPPALPVGTPVQLRSVPEGFDCLSVGGRIVGPVEGWPGYYLVRLNQPARHVAFGRASYLDELRRAATDLEVVA